jgi:hypothetical protein
MTCPVCGYLYLSNDAINHGICPSCGVEFGYDDVTRTHESLRLEWFRHGAEWFDKNVSPPLQWDPIEQVAQAFYERPRFLSVSPKPIMTEFHFDIPGQPGLEVVPRAA